MSIEKRALEYMTERTNSAKDEKQAIIYMVETDEKIKNKLKELENNAWKEVLNKKPEEIHFNPDEIETIVFRKNSDNSDKIVENNDFKDRLRVKEENLNKSGKVVSSNHKSRDQERTE